MRNALVSILLLLLGSCTALKYVPKEESLYKSASVKVISLKKVTNQRKVVSEVEGLLRPTPNRSFLGLRPLLWTYYTIGPLKKETGFKHWIKTNLGEPPVYLSMAEPTLVSKAIDAKLYNMGYFSSYSEYQIAESKSGKTATIGYKLFLYEPYAIGEIIFPKDSDALSKAITLSARKSLLKIDNQYNLDILLDERTRIDNYLKNNGFYYFNPENILFKIDTALGNGKLRLFVTIKPETPEKSKLVYRIADVFVYPDYSLKNDTIRHQKELIDSVNYFDGSGYIRPEPILQSIFLKNNHIYSREKHNLTLNRLNGLGVFKFVNVRIKDKDTTTEGLLTASVFLTPLPKKLISVDFQGVSKSNNFIGPVLILSLRNRNAFKGAELMIYNIRGTFETQFNGQYKGQYTFEINPRVELYIPRFMLPFNLKIKSNYVPKTKFIFDYSYLSRVGYFDLNSLKFTYGYKWKKEITIDHDLSVLSVNYFKISNPSSNFNDLINSNILMKRRFEEQFILGSSYSFSYNEQLTKRKKKNPLYFNGNAELVGNSLSLFSNGAITAENPSMVFGIIYAQYARLDIDVRKYFKLTENTMIASRFIAGWGLPFGNSLTMPYIKQFFSGGAYSLRGFQAFSVGPGSYKPTDSLKNTFFLQQGGEIKLEANIEYRFPIMGMLKGVLFADGGNVWLNKSNAEIPGGEFNSSRFINELAVDAGTGLRFDLSFFVLRLDIAIPLKKPWLPESERWVNKFDASSIVYNIAFGYPF